ncbi:MAG: BrnA antitoxin family protein, partial [Gammaproteobacteria bacterium]|nr:BrnA antitoxin family protein [Gammaproteobacteria bacterium]
DVQAEWLDYAVIVMPARRKERITARFDKDVVDRFKEQGKGYQSRMNAVLHAYYEAQKKWTGRGQPVGVASNHGRSAGRIRRPNFGCIIARPGLGNKPTLRSV